jgi:hypothetical protein
MASWTDSTPVFNPYIQQVPVDKMLAVGMQKQQQYDQGIQRIQSEIDRVAGLDVYRPQDREHLQSKLNDLGSKLRTVAAGDFSNFQLVNSVAGMAGKVAKDPLVLAAVQSTATIRKNGQVMEDARQKGELTPDNEKYYNKYLDKYLQSGLTDDKGSPITFNGKYIPNFDIFKYAKETFDAVKPDNMTWDQVYETDSNGNPRIDPKTKQPIYSPVMIRMEKEGRFPQKVRETLDQIFSDPRVSQQLQITGEYDYQGYDPSMLKQKLIAQQTSTIGVINEEIMKLNLKKNGTNTPEEKSAYDMQIESLQNTISKTNEGYLKLFETADSNPDAVRGILHKDDVKNRYTTMFGYQITKQTNMDNPGWKANFQMQNEIENRRQWAADYNFKVQRALKEDQYKEIDLVLKEKELALKNAKATPTQDFDLANMSSTYDKVVEVNSTYTNASDNFNSASSEFIWKSYYSSLPGMNDRYKQLVLTNDNPAQAINTIIEQDAQKAGKSVQEYRATLEQEALKEFNLKGAQNIPTDLADAMSNYNIAKRTFGDIKAVKDKIDNTTSNKINETVGKLITGDEIKPQTVEFRGQKVNLSKQDIVDLGVYIRGYKHVWGFAIDDGARTAAKSAEDRIRRSGKGDVLDYMMRNAMAGVSPVTRIVRAVGSPIQTIADDWSRITGSTNFDFSQIEKVYDTINNNVYTEGLKEQAEVVDKIWTTRPNLSAPIMTGNAEADRSTLYELKRVASGYGAAGNNSPDFDAFKKNIAGITDAKDLNIQAFVRPVIGGAPQVEIVMYGEESQRLGAMTVQQDEASRFINMSNLYTPDNIYAAENFTNSNGGSTSYGSADDFGTYMIGDAYLQSSNPGDFPVLQGVEGYDVKANIVNSNGGSYGKVFVRDTDTNKMFMFTTAKADFPTVYNTLKAITKTEIMKIVLNANNK